MQREKVCPEVVFKIFTVKHKHVNNFFNEKQAKTIFLQKK